MKIKVDQEKCIGCGTCVALASDFFLLDDAGKAKIIKQPEKEEEEINTAIESCPVKAIKKEKEEKWKKEKWKKAAGQLPFLA